jgi:carboxyl-terminal processing protease
MRVSPRSLLLWCLVGIRVDDVNAFVTHHQLSASSSSSSFSSSAHRHHTKPLAITLRRTFTISTRTALQSQDSNHDFQHAKTAERNDERIHEFNRRHLVTKRATTTTASSPLASLSAIVAALIVLVSTVFSPLAAIANDMGATTTFTQPTLHSSILVADASTSTTSQQQQQQQQEESVIEEVWNLINKYYIDPTFNNQDWNQVKQNALAEAQKSNPSSDVNNMKIITNMVQSLGDKYSRVLDVQQYASIQKYDLIGVGVTLMPNAQKDIIVGAPPIEGSSSAKAGLKVGDYVTAVNGKPTRGRNAFDIIDQISENSNAKTVTFTILRKHQPSSLQSLGDENNGEVFDVTMDRQTMPVQNPVQYKLSERRKDGTNVGYIRISEFNSLVNGALQNALQDLQQQGANAYVLDLRGNTGGAFQSAVEISGMFLRDRVATYVVDRNQVELPFRTTPKNNNNHNQMRDLAIDPKTPMVIWLDGMSASASEVLAGSLHDNCRAITMGDKSFGKGLIQAVYGLKNGAGLVLTVARYVTPSGYEIQGKGVVPDIPGNMPAPVFVPVLSSDTSKVDFQDIAKRLDSKYCQIPAERVPATPPSESLVNSG